MLDHIPFKIISNKVQKTIEDFYHEYTDIDLETFMTTCWGSIYKKGNYSELHSHVPALYSWVYYVDVDETLKILIDRRHSHAAANQLAFF